MKQCPVSAGSEEKTAVDSRVIPQMSRWRETAHNISKSQSSELIWLCLNQGQLLQILVPTSSLSLMRSVEPAVSKRIAAEDLSHCEVGLGNRLFSLACCMGGSSTHLGNLSSASEVRIPFLPSL
jgi:hypothetical protein